MKSRFTIAMITVGGVLGLGLVAFLANGVHEGIANAQRASFAVQGVTSSLPYVAADAAPAPIAAQTFSDNNQLQPLEPARAVPPLRAQNNELDSYHSQPQRGLSASSTQPIVVAIKDGPQLSGDTVNLGAFQFKTIFGMVSIPVDTITGLRMADEPRQQATICLSNGDSLTGTLVTDSVTIKTAWGGATIGRDQIVSIVTTSEPVTWQQHEGRWKIVAAEPLKSEAEADSSERNDEPQGGNQPLPIDSEAAPASSATSPLQPAATPEVNLGT